MDGPVQGEFQSSSYQRLEAGQRHKTLPSEHEAKRNNQQIRQCLEQPAAISGSHFHVFVAFGDACGLLGLLSRLPTSFSFLSLWRPT